MAYPFTDGVGREHRHGKGKLLGRVDQNQPLPIRKVEMFPGTRPAGELVSW